MFQLLGNEYWRFIECKEIQMYALEVGKITDQYFPVSICSYIDLMHVHSESHYIHHQVFVWSLAIKVARNSF